MVDEDPEHTVEGEAVAATLSPLPTDTVTDAVPVQPPDVPVTEYVVVELGFTVMLAVVCPVFQWYEVAPLAVSVLDPPAQIDSGEAAADTVSDEPTATVTEAVPEQPPELVPVTEYAVVEVGLTVMLAVVSPVLH